VEDGGDGTRRAGAAMMAGIGRVTFKEGSHAADANMSVLLDADPDDASSTSSAVHDVASCRSKAVSLSPEKKKNTAVRSSLFLVEY